MIKNKLANRPKVEILEGRALLSAGGLDTSFGGTGIVATKVNSYLTEVAKGVAIQSDLKTVVVGASSNGSSTPTGATDVTIVRYNQNGSLDTAFGAAGIVQIACYPVPTVQNTQFVQIQQDGRIVIGAETYVTTGSGRNAVSRYDLLVERLNANGSIDTTFNGNGRATFDLPQKSVIAAGLTIQPDGKIVIGGGIGTTVSGTGFVAVRFNSNGTLDTSFGPGGKGYVVQSTGSATCMALDASGDVVMGGHDTNPATGAMAPALVRFTPSGQSDSSFGTHGEVFLNTGNSSPGVEALAFQSSGRILATVNYSDPSSGYYAARLTRLNADGSIDTSFGTNGSFSDSTTSWASGLAVQSDDKIVMAGRPSANVAAQSNAFVIDRVLSNGQALDSSFGVGGQSQASLPGYSAGFPYATVIGPDGKITAVGGFVPNSSSPPNYLFTVARFLGDASTTQTTKATAASAPTAASARFVTADLVAPSLPSSTRRAGEGGWYGRGSQAKKSVYASTGSSHARSSVASNGSNWSSLFSSRRFV